MNAPNFSKANPNTIANSINPMAAVIPGTNQVPENRGLTQMNVPEQILALGGKSVESKMYIIYWENSTSTIGWTRCEGRMDCYTKIGQTLAAFDEQDPELRPDILLSKVAVEIPVVNKEGVGVWAMTHPDNAATVYQFCKAMEGYFNEEIRFDVDQYLNEGTEDGDVEYEGPRHVDIRAQMNGERVFGGDAHMSEVYNSALNDPERNVTPGATQEGSEV